MGNQSIKICNVEQLHRKAQNAVNKGFFEAFIGDKGSDHLILAAEVRTQILGLGEDLADLAQESIAVKAVKKGGLKTFEPFPTKTKSTNDRKEPK